jgi:hypothetical protein
VSPALVIFFPLHFYILFILAKHNVEPIELQHDDECVFALNESKVMRMLGIYARNLLTSEEDIHVAYDFVMNDDQKAKSEKWSVLKNDIQNNPPDVD